ncbi:epithelial splicing regulatory protein 1-like isoform X1 [Patiria miniata]|uniref:RRM domain-containing protein n=1 Tax=Patiria miniata TaxID=46514 RepID=A0A914B0S9_PATMI|nr:epithelial splicing regulatory protein 1-like isoform X1 [Patiria miniata]
MANAHNYLVIVFCTTAGQRGALLGTDETDLVLLVWGVIDVETNKLVGFFKQSFVRPDSDSVEVSEDLCKALGVQRDVFKGAAKMEKVLQQFEEFLYRELNLSQGNTLCLLTDGQLHIRQCLHPQALNKNVELPDFFYSFFDLRKEMQKFHPGATTITTVKDMADYLKIDTGSYNFTETGLDECRAMASIVQRLIHEGHRFTNPDQIRRKYEPGTFDKTDTVSDNSVVKARGLPWQASDRDVFRFFKGLNIAKGGVALCLNHYGRRNGEVMVHFESSQHRDMALQRHRHNLGNRYVEVFKGTGDEFIKVAAGTSRDAAMFLSRDDGHIIVRMRGLPFTASAREVVDFFGPAIPVSGAEEGILFVKQRNGKMTGDAFVLFSTEEVANKALEKHKDYLKNRYIEIFRSTTAEVQQVLSRLHSEPLVPEGPPQANVMVPNIIHPPQAHLIPQPHPAAFVPQQLITCGMIRDCIRMRGLPFKATIEDIMRFLGETANYIRPHGVHMVYTMQGNPTGEAFIQMMSAERALQAAQTCHRKYMGERYVEVFQCSGDEMNLALMSGARSKAVQPQVTVQSAIAPTTPQFPYQQQLHSPNGGMIPSTAPLPGTIQARQQTTHAYIQQPLYYFPSPPVSPTTSQLYHHPHASNAIIRLRGLHVGATPQEVANFFQGYGVPAENVQMQYNGDVLVPFYSQELAIKALHEKQRQYTGKMELFMP